MIKMISGKTISRLLIACFLSFKCVQVVALPLNKYHLMIAPGTLTENSVTLLWDKQYGEGMVYEILLNDKPIASTNKTNYTLTQLLPGTSYSVKLRMKQKKIQDVKALESLRFKTASKGRISLQRVKEKNSVS